MCNDRGVGTAQLPVDDGVILAIDQGSSSTRCIAFDTALHPLATAVSPVATQRPAAGMVEHDPIQLLAGVRSAIDSVRSAIAERPVAAVGIANQTETFVLWEAETGRAVTPAVSWQDQRAAELCQALAQLPGTAPAVARTGLALDATFSAPKLAWLFERDPDLHRRAHGGELLFGDVACWLAWQLSDGAGHVTEPSNACRSLLVDLDRLAWDDELCRLFGVPLAMLPEIRPSDRSRLRTSAEVTGFEAPVAAMLGDQPAALFGQGCTRPRMAALTLGTGAFLWLNVGAARPEPPPGVLATAAWELAASGRTYALEAFGANAGNALAVLRELGLLPPHPLAEAPDWSRPHPIVVAAPAGLGTPRWHSADRITMLGASSATTPADLAGAALAGIAHQIADALDAQDARRTMDTVRVGGGLAADAALLQAVADLSGLELEVSTEREATARGIAALAAGAIGAATAQAEPKIAARVTPALDAGSRAIERARWRHAVDVHVSEESGS
ncbi:MAG: glycerol kinase [Gaiellales bacterium]|nr:glycerol kinase [Gaiellales bacterium]